MSQNKYMHPRNIYRTPPNFKELAISYPEFRKFVKQNITGKVSLDFKDKAALNALTTSLLHKDFGLKVEIPADRLVPTLPLRLNYLLWVEDIMQAINIPEGKQVVGVDIGTGASCIYPLLAAKTLKWKMLATEVDPESVQFASRNVLSNGLQDYITVKQVEADSVLAGVIDSEQNYDFTMCNPPFFSSEEEADSCNKSRSDSRPLPHNVKTGSVGELVVSGGERAFIIKMIAESERVKSNVKVFSTMIGQKSSLKTLNQELMQVGIDTSIVTEFCQGHTTRWGLAWTFQPGLNLETVPKNKRKKEKPPMTYVVPAPADPSLLYTVNAVVDNLKLLLGRLQINYKELKEKKHMKTMEISAERNSWSHQRRKRREHKSTKPEEDCSINVAPTSENLKRKAEDEAGDCNKKLKCDSCVYLSAVVCVRKVEEEVHIEMSYVDGTAGRDAVHQVLQYIKNHLKIT